MPLYLISQQRKRAVPNNYVYEIYVYENRWITDFLNACNARKKRPVHESKEAWSCVSFSFVWCVCVAVRCKMTLWQGSCQVRRVQRKSRGTTVKISSVVLVFWSREVVEVWVFRSLSWGKIYENSLCIVFRKAKLISKSWYWWLMRGMMSSFRGFESGQKLFSKFVFGLLCIWFCWLAFQERVPWFLGTLKNCTSPLKLLGQSYKGGLWLFVRIFEAITEGSGCVVFLFFCFVKWSDGVRKIGLCDMCGLRDLCHQM
jgi:hypothetical protein